MRCLCQRTGIVIFRAESSVLYFNADHIRRAVWEKIQATPQLRLVVCDLSDSPLVDVAGATMLAGLHRDLARRDVLLRIVEAHAKVRDLLRAEGLEDRVGYFGRHMSVDQAILELPSRDKLSGQNEILPLPPLEPDGARS
jgi:SulP family sulfate permease